MRLSLHQLSTPVMHTCYTCFNTFPNFNDYNHHACKNPHSVRLNTGLFCKFGCNKDRHFINEEALQTHIFSLHGASLEDNPLNQDTMKFCILCKGFVNAFRLSLEDHTYFRCNGRHPWIKENIQGLYNLAREQGLNLEMLIKLELECQLEEWKARDVLRGQTTGLIKVPNNTSKDIVLKCLPKEDKKYNPNEFPFLLPPFMAMNKGLLLQINPKYDSLKIFHMWNSVSNF